MTLHSEWLDKNTRPCSANIYTANDGIMEATLIGDTKLYTLTNNVAEHVDIKDVYYIPKISANLRSQREATLCSPPIFMKFARIVGDII